MNGLTIEMKAAALEYIRTHNGTEAMELSLVINRVFNTRLDWHEFSMYMDQEHTKHNLKVVGFTSSMMTKYCVVTGSEAQYV